MQNINDIINTIAQKHGVSPHEIRAEMQSAINESYENASSPPDDTGMWELYNEASNTLTVENFLMYIAIKIMLSV